MPREVRSSLSQCTRADRLCVFVLFSLLVSANIAILVLIIFSAPCWPPIFATEMKPHASSNADSSCRAPHMTPDDEERSRWGSTIRRQSGRFLRMSRRLGACLPSYPTPRLLPQPPLPPSVSAPLVYSPLPFLTISLLSSSFFALRFLVFPPSPFPSEVGRSFFVLSSVSMSLPFPKGLMLILALRMLQSRPYVAQRYVWLPSIRDLLIQCARLLRRRSHLTPASACYS